SAAAFSCACLTSCSAFSRVISPWSTRACSRLTTVLRSSSSDCCSETANAGVAQAKPARIASADRVARVDRLITLSPESNWSRPPRGQTAADPSGTRIVGCRDDAFVTRRVRRDSGCRLSFTIRGVTPHPTNITDALQRAAILHQQGQLAAAASALEDILRTDERNSQALYMLGVIALQRGNGAQAVQSLQRAVRSDPNLLGAHVNLGTPLLTQGRPQDALDSYDRALRLKADAALIWFNRGNALRRLRRHSEALSSYERALALDPQHAGALGNRAMTLVDLGRPLEALAGFDAELRLRPEDPVGLNNRSHALLELGRAEEALKSCERALAM